MIAYFLFFCQSEIQAAVISIPVSFYPHLPNVFNLKVDNVRTYNFKKTWNRSPDPAAAKLLKRFVILFTLSYANIPILVQILRNSKSSPRIRGGIASGYGDFSMKSMKKKRSLIWLQLLIEAVLTDLNNTVPCLYTNNQWSSIASLHKQAKVFPVFRLAPIFLVLSQFHCGPIFVLILSKGICRN